MTDNVIFVAVHLVFLYMMFGIVFNLLSGDRRIRFAGRVAVFFGWPWFLRNEATPKMEAFIRWAEKK